MYYCTIGMLAILVLIIENHDIVLRSGKKQKVTVWKVYRRFLYAVLLYYASDVVWGIFEYFKLRVPLFIDTVIYFILMSVGVLFWTKYAVAYLDEKNAFGKFLVYAGRIFFVVVTLLLCINMFFPIMFIVDEGSVYHASPVRYVMLVVQIVLLLLISVYAFAYMVMKKDATKNRYKTMALFGMIMSLFLFVQLWFPYLPLYSVAYMLGTCLLHTFVVNDEKEEYKIRLEEAYERERQQYEELKSARAAAYRDPLTGVKNKTAYVEMEEIINLRIREKKISEFAVAVFDLNGLKDINDRLGHEKGDKFIKDACMVICRCFKHSPVFRVGGDEFVAFLERSDYENRIELKKSFDSKMDLQTDENMAVIAMGMSDFVEGEDLCLNDVFIRADERMYIRKHELKNK